MEEKLVKDYQTLRDFWNNNFNYSDDIKKQIIDSIDPEKDWMDLAPSKKQFDAISSLKNHNNFLDYGCGDGWASIIAAKAGLKNVTGVDVSSNAIQIADFYKSIFKTDKANFISIDTSWLKNQKDKTYDALFTSNVVDVVPFEIAKEIIKEISRITTDDADVIFSFNYYMPLDKAKERGFEVEDSNIYINGVLRLMSKTDEEWKEVFEQYFDVVKLDYFAWPNEPSETRRLFFLKKKKI